MCPTIIMFLGLLLRTRWSAIGRCFSPSPVVVREVFKSSWTSFPLVSEVLNEGSIFFFNLQFYVCPKLASIVLGIVPPVAIAIVMYGRYLRSITKKTQDSLAQSTQVLVCTKLHFIH